MPRLFQPATVSMPSSSAQAESPTIATHPSYGRAAGKGGKHGGQPRHLVVVLDGTGNAFAPDISSMPTLFSFLSAERDRTCLYYQSGIGTINPTWTPFGIVRRISRAIDSAIAWDLPNHVRQAYQFLSNYYRPGDLIWIFGFSRGAFTARALAGMIQQVGLLLPGNEQSVSLAYQIYSAGADQRFVPGGETLAHAFKRSFSRDAGVHFVGVWDTVASVGALVPRTLPFSAGSSEVKHFRQALALDERRVRFTPQPWMPDDTDTACTSKESLHETKPTVKEVWFNGAHSDVGGGRLDTDGDVSPRLSHISLRWMIREALEQGLPLDMPALEQSPIYSPFLEEASRRLNEKDADLLDYIAHVKFAREVDIATIALVFVATLPSDEARGDAVAPRGDRLSFEISKKPGASLKERLTALPGRLKQRFSAALWWLLELFPTLTIEWDVEGNYRSRHWRMNFGKSRNLPPDPTFHYTVRDRLQAAPSTFPPGDGFSVPESEYELKAKFYGTESLSTVRWDDGKWKEEGQV